MSQALPHAAVPALLGIDVGTSSAKVVLLGLDGAIMAQATSDYEVFSNAPGWAESDPADWWAAVVSAVRQAVSGAPASVQAIGLSGQMHGLVLASAAGAPMRPAMLHPDTRAVAQMARYQPLPDATLRRLANPLSPNMAGPMLLWAATEAKEAYRGARWALQPKDWLRWRLTGTVASEPSDASATLLYDVAGDRWDEETVEALGLETSLLAPLLPSAGSPAGELTPAAAELLGLPSGLPVAAGGGDTAVAALGTALLEPGGVQLTIGTGGQVITLRARPIDSLATGTHLYRTATPQGWYSMAAILNAGLALGWVRGMLNADWAELYASAQAPRVAGAPLFLPHLSGERTPYLDATMRGAWTGLSLGHGRAALLRAALEGVAFALSDALDALHIDETAPIRLAGGGSTAPPWRQLLADVLGHPLQALEVSSASGRGAALLGGVAAGLVSYADIQGPLAPDAGACIQVDDAATDYYAGRRIAFQHAIEALRTHQQPNA